MAYEVLTGFFLKAGFLGVMLFCINKVGRGLHFFATCMVALGTFISATWIISTNSWMHTPTRFTINAQGQFVPAGSWLPIISNPGFPYRLMHVVIAAYLTTSLVVGAVSAWHLLRDRANPGARKMFSMAMWMVAIAAPVQILAGDAHGLNTLEHQPAKVMAMEGHFDSHPDGAVDPVRHPQPGREAGRLYDRGAKGIIADPEARPERAARWLDTIPADHEPPVAVIFWSFRVMVGLGMAMLGLGLFSLVVRFRKRLYEWPWLHRLALVMGPSGFVAVIAGWITTEVGRQPYTVYGHLLTAQSHSPLHASAVSVSLMTFVVVYFIVFGAGTYYLLRLMHKAPEPHESEPASIPQRASGITPASALSKE